MGYNVKLYQERKAQLYQERKAQLYQERKTQHICVKCGKEQADNGSVMCVHCKEKKRLNQQRKRHEERESYEKELERQRIKYSANKEAELARQRNYYQQNHDTKRAKQKERYLWLKAHHICVQCGQREAVYNMVRCEICLEKQELLEADQQAKNRSARLIRLRRITAGLCEKCGKPATDGLTVCDKHRNQRIADNAKYYNYKRKCTDEELHEIRSECGKKNILIAIASPNSAKQREKFKQFHDIIFGEK